MKLSKLFNPKSYLKQIKKVVSFLPKPPMAYNFIVDKMICPVDFEELGKLEDVHINTFEIDRDEYQLWVKRHFPNYKKMFGSIQHKKFIELYSTFKILNIDSEDIYLDAAGGRYTYINDLDCKRKIMQDLKLPQDFRVFIDNDIELLECSVSEIKLPDESIDKISCHHSFEHFQADADIEFVKEIQRLLEPSGKCCIIPIFIADKYVEITDDFTFDMKFDDRSERIIDPSASIPGKKGSGHYARVYDLNAFQTRILDRIDTEKFAVSLSELRMNAEPLPDLTLTCHKKITAINRPNRIMTIERLK